MANPTCSATTLIDNAACYKKGVLNYEQQLALLVYGMVLELAAIGGTDYSSVMTTTLLTDSNSVVGTLKQDQIISALVARQFANATAAGATVPSDIDDKLEAIKCIQHLPGGELGLYRLILWLICNLGVHKAYVQ